MVTERSGVPRSVARTRRCGHAATRLLDGRTALLYALDTRGHIPVQQIARPHCTHRATRSTSSRAGRGTSVSATATSAASTCASCLLGRGHAPIGHR
eukprot:6285715-Prymnesium_polylepis.1